MTRSRWATDLVVVVSTLDGHLSPGLELQRRRGFQDATFVPVQRTQPDRPHYAPNYGYEAGAYVHFVVAHYHDLPNRTAFVQNFVKDHNPQLMSWLQCVREDTDYAPLTAPRLTLRRVHDPADTMHLEDGLGEHCVRNMLDAAGFAALHRPRVWPSISYFHGACFLASRRQLRARPLASYRAMHSLLAGGDGHCVHSSIAWDRLVARRPNSSTEGDMDTGPSVPAGAPGGPEPKNGSVARRGGSKWSAFAFEALQHAIIGNMSLASPRTYDYCTDFWPQERCSGHVSPCTGLYTERSEHNVNVTVSTLSGRQ